MKPQDFAALAAQDYNRIPVSTEVLADLETPISAYRKLAEGPFLFLRVRPGRREVGPLLHYWLALPHPA